jgi:hypothetical protein
MQIANRIAPEHLVVDSESLIRRPVSSRITACPVDVAKMYRAMSAAILFTGVT